MVGTAIYETKAKFRPYLIIDEDRHVVNFDRFDPFYEDTPDGIEKIYFRYDSEKSDKLINAIMKRMEKIGVAPGDETKTVAFAKDGFPRFVGKTIDNFIDGSLRQYVYKHWITSFDDLLNHISNYIPDRSFVRKPKADRWEPSEFVLTVNKPVFRRSNSNKKRNTFDFIDIEMVIRSTDVDKKKVIENKQEIFDKAIAKLETSKRFQNYGVPVSFLKMYQFVLRKDGALLISFCLKGETLC